jgi:hypothetical protein
MLWRHCLFNGFRKIKIVAEDVERPIKIYFKLKHTKKKGPRYLQVPLKSLVP